MVVLLLMVLAVGTRCGLGWRLKHVETVVNHSADDEAHGPAIGIGNALDSLRDFTCDPSVNPGVEAFLHHDTLVPARWTFADVR
jgi:hypothetical protein